MQWCVICYAELCAIFVCYKTMSRINKNLIGGRAYNPENNINVDDIIRLQLKKPKHWKWELSTSRSSPHIPLPVIQLFDDKKNLLVETKAYDRKSWHVNDKPLRHSSSRTRLPTIEAAPSSLLKRYDYPASTSRKYSTFSNSDESYVNNKYKLNTDDRIRIREQNILLKKSRSDVFSGNSKRTTTTDTGYNSLLNKVKPKLEEATFRNHRNKDKYKECTITDINQNKYTLRSCSAGTLVIKEESNNNKDVKRRRRRKTSEIRNNSSSCSSDGENYKNLNTNNNGVTSKSRQKVVRRYTDLSLLSDVRKKYDKRKNNSFTDIKIEANKYLDKYKNSDLKYEYEPLVYKTLSSKSSDVIKCSQSQDSNNILSMGANFSRHSSKGLSGRRCQSISNICNSKDHFLDPSARDREVDAAYKFCNSLPSPNGTVYNNNYEHKPLTKKTSLQHTVSEHNVIDPEREHQPNECHPLQWKFTDTQTCDQGYGSERSPEEEIPPPIPSHEHDYECEHTIDFCYSNYPFILPENTFEVELVKGSRGLGLSVCGGIDSDGSWPGLMRIKRLFPHQPAAASGLLQVGDLLLEANGVALTGLSNYEALEVLRMTPNQVLLLVCRPPPEVLSTMSPVSEVPPPPPRRATTPTVCLSKLSEDVYETEFEIILNKIHGSLGFTLCKEEDGISGHYVRALVREPAISDGRIQPGDKIVAVNGVEISGMTHEQAVQFLRQCDNDVLLRLRRELDRTPADLSPTDTSPNSSFRPKPNLRQEAVDMLSDLAARKLCSSSPCTSPRHLRQDPGASHFESLYFETDDDKAVRPCFLDLYNPNQTPVAVRKSKFNLSLAHNAYELNNLDPEMLDAPNLNCTNYECDHHLQHAHEDNINEYPEEPVSMPPMSTTKCSGNFSHKKPVYQSADLHSIGRTQAHPHPHPHPTVSTSKSHPSMAPSTSFKAQTPGPGCSHRDRDMIIVDEYSTVSIDVVDEGMNGQGDEPHNYSKWKDVVFSAAEKDLMDSDAQILNIELNRGWNSRLGFSLQDVDGNTCVSAVYPDSVAAKDGRIKQGDCLIKVNDEMVENMKTSDVIDLLRIIRGPICITVLRRKK